MPNLGGRQAGRPVLPDYVFPRHLQGHGAGDGNHVVFADRANQLVGGPGFDFVVVDQPANHVGGGKLEGAIERTGELGLCADARIHWTGCLRLMPPKSPFRMTTWILQGITGAIRASSK